MIVEAIKGHKALFWAWDPSSSIRPLSHVKFMTHVLAQGTLETPQAYMINKSILVEMKKADTIFLEELCFVQSCITIILSCFDTTTKHDSDRAVSCSHS